MGNNGRRAKGVGEGGGKGSPGVSEIILRNRGDCHTFVIHTKVLLRGKKKVGPCSNNFKGIYKRLFYFER